jgi:hypothetical protein
VGLGIDVDALVHALAPKSESSGWVFAERDLSSPVFARAAEEKRVLGERAVLVRAEDADTYAGSNGYRIIVEMADSGEARSRVVPVDTEA